MKKIIARRMKGKEYILCSAIKRIRTRDIIEITSPMEYSVYENISEEKNGNDIYDIEIGYRHHDILERFCGIVSKNPKDQGFYTSKGRFVDRFEAMEIAKKAGQVDETISRKRLFSEDLY